MRPVLTIAPPLLARTLRAAATLPPCQARGLVDALLAGDEGEDDPASARLAAEHYARRKPSIRRMYRAIQRHLAYALHETVRNLEELGHRVGQPLTAAENTGVGGVAADIAFDAGRFGKGLSIAIRNESAQALETAGAQLATELGTKPLDPMSKTDPAALRFLEGRENLLKGVSDEIHGQVMQTISKGLEAGDSTRNLAKRITGKFTEISKGRAMTVASTETAAAFGFARQEGMTRAGVQYKGWLTSHLKNVRAAHAAAERDPRNKAVPVDQPFHVGGEALMYPGDPAGSAGNTINCHCVSVARKG